MLPICVDCGDSFRVPHACVPRPRQMSQLELLVYENLEDLKRKARLALLKDRAQLWSEHEEDA